MINLREARADGDFKALMEVAGNPAELNTEEIAGFVEREVAMINYFAKTFSHDDGMSILDMPFTVASIKFIQKLLDNPNASMQTLEYVVTNCLFEPLSDYAANYLWA